MGAPSRSFVGKENKRPGALEKRRILFPGKEGKLVEQPVEMHFLVNVGLVGLFLVTVKPNRA